MDTIGAVGLAIFLIVTGVAHFVVPGYFRTLVPTWLGRASLLVAATGVAEIVVGALVLVPAGRSAGSWAAAALITGYLVSHVDALWHARADRPRKLDRPLGALARLVVNGVYIAWAVAVARYTA
ncbi:DoxX family protein [Microtetraspora malaysiensis]|uniref:DoxX family protein n=1 Tax=Microtetraspora malaysiensis TaxID=161358 RepID=UPI003D947D51